MLGATGVVETKLSQRLYRPTRERGDTLGELDH